jgi:hypothetical protein
MLGVSYSIIGNSPLLEQTLNDQAANLLEIVAKYGHVPIVTPDELNCDPEIIARYAGRVAASSAEDEGQ